MKPKFLIIGAMKSGTTYAFNLLRQHPDLELPKEKEIHFFDINYKYGKKYYEYQFPIKFFKKSCISGEASPYYLYHPLAAKRAYKYNPNFKIIIFLRNPVDRAISHFNMISNHEKIEIFPNRLNLFKEELAIQKIMGKKIIDGKISYNRIHRTFSFISRGLYLKQIKEWEKYFPSNNFLIIKSEDLYKYPKREINKICNFIGVNELDHLDINVNKFKGKYNITIPKEIKQNLKLFYKQYNKELEKHINRKFNW